MEINEILTNFSQVVPTDRSVDVFQLLFNTSYKLKYPSTGGNNLQGPRRSADSTIFVNVGKMKSGFIGKQLLFDSQIVIAGLINAYV